MEVFEKNKGFKIINGNSLEVLDTLEPNSIDAIITDPPYELGFMGKKWDSSGIAYNVDLWKKALKVLKPGGHLLAFGGTRTYHRICCAIEDAGFEIRDCVMWLYGSGFPKSMALDKAIEGKLTTGSANKTQFKKLNGELVDRGNYGFAKMMNEQGNRPADYNNIKEKRLDKLNPTTEESKKWSGWGTALKPAYEPIIVARKPCEGSVTDNVLKHRVGGINIDECRVGELGGVKKINIAPNSGSKNCAFGCNGDLEDLGMGRFPANVILTYDETDEKEVCGGMPYSKSNGGKSTMADFKYIGHKQSEMGNKNSLSFGQIENAPRKENDYIAPEDEGSAARYFYCAKASKKDRDSGLIEFEEKTDAIKKNFHPTVKPVELMQYLIKLVTPKGGVVLDIFNGSGSTGKAVAFENRERDANYKYIGIELDKEYCRISESRIDYALNQYKYDIMEEIKENKDKGQLSLFDYNNEEEGD